MQKKLTITIDEKVYQGLYSSVGPRHISKFIGNLLRPHVLIPDMEAAYQEMAEEEEREAEALDWTESALGDIRDEAR